MQESVDGRVREKEERMLRRSSVLMGLVVAALCLGLTACATSGGSGSGKSITVGFINPTLTNPYFVGLQKGAEEGAKQYGFKLIKTNSNNDAGTQYNQVVDMVNRQVDAIVVSPIDAKGIVPAIKRANSAGIPVFTLDRGAAGGKVTSKVMINNAKAGEKAANFIVGKLKQRYGSPKGNVVDLEGLSGTDVANEREAGFQKVIKKYPNIKVVANQAADFDQEKAFNTTKNILQANPKVDAIFAANDDMAVGAERAIGSTGRFAPIGSKKHIVIVGIDGSPQALSAIRSGKQDATVSQNPIREAKTCFALVNEKLAKKKSIPGTSVLPTMVITKQNINSQKVKNYGLWGEQVKP